MNFHLRIPMVMLILAGAAAAGEVVVLECPECGLVSGEMLYGVGRYMHSSKEVYWEPGEDRFVSMTCLTGRTFEEERGLALEPGFYAGGGDRWELWEEYLLFFGDIVWPDTIRFPMDMDRFDPELPEFAVETVFVRLSEPGTCPLCGADMLRHRTGVWD